MAVEAGSEVRIDMEIQATLSGDEICIGSTFSLSASRVRIADVIIFGNLVSGFVTPARVEHLVVDIRTAVLECVPAVESVAGKAWKVSKLSVPECTRG